VSLAGLVPAAGRAERLGPLPCSKEILPVAVREAGEAHFETAGSRLLRQFALAGVRRGFVVLDEDKWDVARYLGDGRDLGLDLAYLTVRRSPSTPATIDRAFEHVRDAIVVFGFPDILLRPDDAFARLLDRLGDTGADAVLGLFPADRPEKVDMVETEKSGRVRRILIKPDRTELELAWIVAVWTPAFTDYLHEFVAAGSVGRSPGRELYVGDVLQAAAADGVHIDTTAFPDGAFLDIGTPEDLLRALRQTW
jgi:glucose-1-phosphate thymidylyltransferase